MRSQLYAILSSLVWLWKEVGEMVPGGPAQEYESQRKEGDYGGVKIAPSAHCTTYIQYSEV